MIRYLPVSLNTTFNSSLVVSSWVKSLTTRTSRTMSSWCLPVTRQLIVTVEPSNTGPAGSIHNSMLATDRKHAKPDTNKWQQNIFYLLTSFRIQNFGESQHFTPSIKRNSFWYQNEFNQRIIIITHVFSSVNRPILELWSLWRNTFLWTVLLTLLTYYRLLYYLRLKFPML